MLNNTPILTQELEVGENYKFQFESQQKNITFINKTTTYRITIKNANVIKEVGGFTQIKFDDFDFNSKTGVVQGECLFAVKSFSETLDCVSINFCPTKVGSVEINVYANGSKIITYTNLSKLI